MTPFEEYRARLVGAIEADRASAYALATRHPEALGRFLAEHHLRCAYLRRQLARLADDLERLGHEPIGASSPDRDPGA